MKVFIYILGLLAVIVIAPIWLGYVISILWVWFVVPVFHVPALPIAYAIGFSLLIGLFTAERPDNDADEKKVNSVAFALIYPLIVLGVASIVHLFV